MMPSDTGRVLNFNMRISMYTYALHAISAHRSSDEHGLCYIDTQNLDGEANLKQREVPRGILDKVWIKCCRMLIKPFFIAPGGLILFGA